MYNFAIHLYALAVKLVLPFHKKARMMYSGQRETFVLLKEKIDPAAKYVWFHASSLGEFEQGRPMIEKVRREYPHYKILLTFFSPSGYEVRKNYEGADLVCYLPFDKKRNVKKFLDLANPSFAIFIKYEFWANYLSELHRRHIPTYIISAIFRKDQVFFKWYGSGYRKVLCCFDRLFVQDEASRKLLADYGVTNVSVTGDTRFDRVVDVREQAKLLPLVEKFVASQHTGKCFTMVAGSSWPEDEKILLDYFNRHPEMKLIVAPHEIHVEHLVYIESLLKRPSVRFSEAKEDSVSDADCLIIDSFGLLSSVYRYGELAYIGGGFGAGIHNVLEAAVYGIPVFFGPKYQKFKEAKDLIVSGGGFSISNGRMFQERMDEMLAYKELLDTAGKAAGGFVTQYVGVTDKILKELPL